MGQTKEQQKKKGRPQSAGRYSAKIAWYWSARHSGNMARRAWQHARRVCYFATRGERKPKAGPHNHQLCYVAGLQCAKAHGPFVDIAYGKLVKAAGWEINFQP